MLPWLRNMKIDQGTVDLEALRILSPDTVDPEAVIILSPDAVDDLLSKELLQLSLNDRNAIVEEVHGVLTLAPDETPQFLEEALLRLSKELDNIPNHSPSKAAYLKSQKLPQTYVNSNDFRLRFLRCDLFNAKMAATRMLVFLDLASDLFGADLLQRPVRITDLSRDGEKLCRDGYVQVLPYRDGAGRPIIAWVGNFAMQGGTDRNRLRVILYICYALTEDIENQRKGYVKITFIGSNSLAGTPTLSGVKLFFKFNEANPLRKSAIHFCIPDKAVHHWLRSMYAQLHFSYRGRFKFHVGTSLAVRHLIRLSFETFLLYNLWYA